MKLHKAYEKLPAAYVKLSILIFAILTNSFIGFCDEEKKEIDFNTLSDTVNTAVNKAAALLTLNLEITMSPENNSKPNQYSINAIGQKVPKYSAIKSASALHNDQPL